MGFKVFRDVVKGFPPSWGAAVMGSGIVAVCSKLYLRPEWLAEEVADALTYFTLAVFTVVAIPWIARWVMYPEGMVSEMNHPVRGNFMPTLPIGMLVISAAMIKVLGWFEPAFWFWVVGTALTIFFGVAIPYNMFKGEHVRLDHINPSWFIPPVGLIVIPITGSTLMNHYVGLARDALLTINLISWGSGFLIYIALMSMCVHRFILHVRLECPLVPTMWINLGPIGAGLVSLYGIAAYASGISEGVRHSLMFAGALLWGAGMWWLAMAALMTIHYKRSLRLPYAPSWWAFVFPLGAYVASTEMVSSFLKSQVVIGVGYSLYALLLFFWISTLVKSIARNFIPALKLMLKPEGVGNPD